MKINEKLVSVFAALFICSFTVFADSHSSSQMADTSVQTRTATIGVIAQSDFVPDRVDPQQGEQIGLPDLLTDRIIEHLANSRRFRPVERTALRRVILEQRFGQNIQKSYLDKTLDKAIDAMESFKGGGVHIAAGGGNPPGRIVGGAGPVATTAAIADYKDLISDYQDLGKAVGADYLVLGKLEKFVRSTKESAVPYSTEGRKVHKSVVDARLRLRVIAMADGTVVAATSIRDKLSEVLFQGRESDSDQFTAFDHLGRLAATKILDATFPARVVSMEPMVISRGRNEGVTKGDIYRIDREGKELRDANGLLISQLTNQVGQVEVIEPQETVSIVRPIAAGDILNGDLASLDVDANSVAADIPDAATVPIAGRQVDSATPVQLPRVAVGLIKAESTAKTGQDAQKHSPIFTDTIISRLTQTRRFQLIDRQEVDQLLKEQQAQAMTANRDMPSAMGTLKGADYLVYGNLASFSVEEKTTQLPNSTRTFKQRIGFVEGNMRIVDARSGDVLESRKISVNQPVDVSAKNTRMVDSLADAYAEQVVLLLMNAIYPIKVAHVGGDGTIYVNRGDDGGLYVDEILDAFAVGQAIIDPDTGVKLGVEERLIGQVQLIEVEDARSKARMLTGIPPVKGDLLKRTPDNKGKRAAVALKEQQTRPKYSGGNIPSGTPITDGKAQAMPTLAVGLVRINPSARTTAFGKDQVKRISDEMIAKLTNTRRFVLMERLEVDQILDEKAFEAVAAGGDIQDRLRELVGADYLIHGEVTNFYMDVQRVKVPYLNEVETITTTVAEGIFRIVDVHTGAVTSSEKVRITDRYRGAEDSTLLISDLIDRFTTESVALILARLYPVKVMGTAANGVVYLNRGKDAGLQIGTVFDVMRPGQELIDPDTGRSSGHAEVKVASVSIIAVEATRSRAQTLSGSLARAGDILRLPPPQTEQNEEPEVVKPAW